MSFLTDRARANNHGSAKEGADHGHQRDVAEAHRFAAERGGGFQNLAIHRKWNPRPINGYSIGVPVDVQTGISESQGVFPD